MEILFWIGVIGALYSYFVYPLLLLIVPRRRARTVAGRTLPTVSVIVAARNEASRIVAKLENTLACDYPKERLEILVASDASEDRTDALVRAYEAQGVQLVRVEPRLGKEHAQRVAIERASGDILVFTDAATRLDPQGLRNIVQPFSDSMVGAVSSEDRFLSPDGTPAGEGAYVRYEMALRRLESRAGGLVGLSGCFFAARREVCRDWDTATPSDFNTAINCARDGYVAVVAPNAIAYYRDIVGDSREYRRKYRTVLRGMASLWRHRGALNPLHYGLFAWQLWSHKVLRWAVPWFLLLLLIASLPLSSPPYQAALVLQLSFYALVFLGMVSARLRRFGPVRIAYFFMEVNAAIALAARPERAGATGCGASSSSKNGILSSP